MFTDWLLNTDTTAGMSNYNPPAINCGVKFISFFCCGPGMGKHKTFSISWCLVLCFMLRPPADIPISLTILFPVLVCICVQGFKFALMRKKA